MTRRTFLGTSGAAAQAASPAPATGKLDAVRIARRHPLVRTQPTPDFFEGILLGNGDIGVCVTVRPDGLGLHIGKNDSWDIRVSEDHIAHVKPFREVLDMWKRAGEEAKRRGGFLLPPAFPGDRAQRRRAETASLGPGQLFCAARHRLRQVGGGPGGHAAVADLFQRRSGAALPPRPGAVHETRHEGTGRPRARRGNAAGGGPGGQPAPRVRRALGQVLGEIRGGVADAELEAIWYQNQYFLACCLKPGVVAPGLFGNWTSGKIGIAWHGDYHMNYNTQQVWWGVFSSNHAEQHEPYTRLVESLIPMARWNARVQFGLPGAYFPHSAYPVPSSVNPYPAPPWGYEICETPWTVQSLRWEYLYTLDEAYLRRVYPILREAAEFLMAFVTKGEDGRYHIVPTVSPENWGATVDYRLNRDCIIDLALTEFLLDALGQASQALGVDAALRPRWEEVRRNLAPYPVVDGPFGKVWLDVLDAPAEHVYNVPVTLAPVFPAEQVGIGKRPELWEIARRTAKTVRLEGGNDLVWQPLARARLGMLDLQWFKREVAYSRTPLGIANDRVRQTGGRYRDETSFDHMMRMGVWTENLSLPAVLNECLLQSYAGVIRLFPNTAKLGRAAFRDLRAAGAFLVSAGWDGGAVTGVTLKSEKGSPARLANPWPGRQAAVFVLPGRNRTQSTERDGIVEFATRAGAVYSIEPAMRGGGR